MLTAATVQTLADKADTLGTESIRARTPNPLLKPASAVCEAWENTAKAAGTLPRSEQGIEAPEITEGRDTLTLEELRAVCSTAQGELRLLLAFGVFCGCRLGDACRLQWQNVDFRKKSLRYVPAKTAGKSEIEVVEVGLNPELLALLRETASEKREGYIMTDFARRYVDPGPWSVSSEVQDHLTACGLETNRKRIAGGKRKEELLKYAAG